MLILIIYLPKISYLNSYGKQQNLLTLSPSPIFSSVIIKREKDKEKIKEK